jgi:hypothetical protein
MHASLNEDLIQPKKLEMGIPHRTGGRTGHCDWGSHEITPGWSFHFVCLLLRGSKLSPKAILEIAFPLKTAIQERSKRGLSLGPSCCSDERLIGGPPIAFGRNECTGVHQLLRKLQRTLLKAGNASREIIHERVEL